VSAWRLLAVAITLACPAGVAVAIVLRTAWRFPRMHPPAWLPPTLALATLTTLHLGYAGPTLEWTAALAAWQGPLQDYASIQAAALVALVQAALWYGQQTAGTLPVQLPAESAVIVQAFRASFASATTSLPLPPIPTLPATTPPDAVTYLAVTWRPALALGVSLAALWPVLARILVAPRVPTVPDARARTLSLKGAPAGGHAGTGTLPGLAGPAWADDDAPRLVNVGTERRPVGRQAWVVQDVVPAGHVSLLYGAPGLGKSTVAAHLALHVATGRSWLGYAVPAGGMPVLYVDGELDAAVFRRRVAALAAGLGLPGGRPPRNVYYLHYEGELLGEAGAATIALVRRQLWRCVPVWQRWACRLLRRPPAVCIIYDSLTVVGGLGQAAHDADVTAAMKAMRRAWVGSNGKGCLLAIDHVPKAQGRADWREALPFASGAKKMHGRSMLVLGPPDKAARRQGATLELYHHKSNFSKPFGSLYVQADQAGEEGPWQYVPVTIETREPATQSADHGQVVVDAEPPAVVTTTAPADRYVQALTEAGETGLTDMEIAATFGITRKTVRNRLYALHRQGAVRTDGKGRWWVGAEAEQAEGAETEMEKAA